MSKRTCISLCSGFGGWDIGAKAAGLTPIGALEIDSAFAEVYRANVGDHVVVGDIRKVSPRRFERPWLLLASPPCQTFSVARKSGRAKTTHDPLLALEVLRFVKVLRPEYVFIENVVPFRNSEAYKRLLPALTQLGYFVAVDHLYAPNFGVAQTRRRLVIRGSRSHLLHSLGRAQQKQRVRPNWHAVISDLFETMPESDFSPWQIDKGLPSNLDCFLAPGQHSRQGGSRAWRYAHEPAPTVMASSKGPARVQVQPGHVVAITPRANARLQTFPDSFALPDHAETANAGVGNAVPPVLATRLCELVIAEERES